MYYTLGTSFILPPEANERLTDSIKLYQMAISLTTSPLLQLDALFNLAQSYSSLADILEEITPVPSARLEARDALQKVLAGQVEYLERTAAEAALTSDGDAAGEAMEDMEGDAADPVTEATRAGGTEGDSAMEVDAGDDNDNDGDESQEGTFETYLPTQSSVIDTVLALVDIHLSLWESKTPTSPPTAEEQMAVRQILDQAAAYVPPGRQAEVDLAEIKVLMAVDRIIWELFSSQAHAGAASERSLDGAIGALSALLANLDAVPPDEPIVRAEILTTLAETHMTVASRMMFLGDKHDTPQASPQSQQAWYHLGQAVTHLTTALDLPISPSTPKEFKPSVLLSLSSASLLRAKLYPYNDAAKRNLLQLIDNAATYARRAGDALGMPWMGIDGDVPSSIVLPHMAGWDAELLGRNIYFQQIRNCIWASTDEGFPEGEGKRWEKGLRRLLAAAEAISDKARKPGADDVDRYATALSEEQSEGLWSGYTTEEAQAWHSVAQNLDPSIGR